MPTGHLTDNVTSKDSFKWYESADSIQYRVLQVDASNQVTYADANTDIPVGISYEDDISTGEPIPVAVGPGERVYLTASAAIPSDGGTYPFVEATTDGKVKAFVVGVNHYSPAILLEPATAADQIVVGILLPAGTAPNLA